MIRIGEMTSRLHQLERLSKLKEPMEDHIHTHTHTHSHKANSKENEP
jgi:hypothetical protein